MITPILRMYTVLDVLIFASQQCLCQIVLMFLSKRVYFLFALVLVVACIFPQRGYSQDPAGPDLSAPPTVMPEEKEWQSWLAGLRAEALEKGIKPATLEALNGLKPIPRVIELDRAQPEFKLTLSQYLNRVASPTRMRQAREKLQANRDLLLRIESLYGVQPRFLVALWGVETNFGGISGGFDVIPALATLAYDGRRSEFFRKQLFNALTILDQGHITADKMLGSWAGAMGQTQFMPSTFVGYAVDFDGDGRRDLWGSHADALASGAHYLKNVGWNNDLTWGREVSLPADFDPHQAGLKPEKARSLAEWHALGVRRLNGHHLPQRDIKGFIVLPEGEEPGKRAFLVYDNYQALLKWNRSNFFAIAVGMIADSLKGF